MFRLDKIIKPWKDAGSLNANVNLYGFWDETTFLTKSGDLGIVLKVCGVDFESLDQAGQEFCVRRLEAALKAFGPGFHIYQYLFKTNRPDMPFAKYGDPLIDAAVEQPVAFRLEELASLTRLFLRVRGQRPASPLRSGAFRATLQAHGESSRHSSPATA